MNACVVIQRLKFVLLHPKDILDLALEVFRCRAYDLCERKMSPFPDVELEGDSQRGLATNLF